jgi:hypothetical protein
MKTDYSYSDAFKMERKPFNTSSSAMPMQATKSGMGGMGSGSGDAEMLIRPRYRTVSIRPYPPPRTTFAAITMLLVGICLLIAGLVVYFEKNHATQRGKDGAIPMMALGGICK